MREKYCNNCERLLSINKDLHAELKAYDDTGRKQWYTANMEKLGTERDQALERVKVLEAALKK